MGAHDEYEQKFLQKKRIYVIWDSLDVDFSLLSKRDELITAIVENYPDEKYKPI